MSLVGDITQAYRAPRRAMQAQIDRGITEPQTLFFGMFFGMMNFIANYPRISSTAPEQGAVFQDISVQLIGNILILPLALYGFAAIIHLIMRMFSGRASWAEARRAMNWSAVVIIPFILMNGVMYLFENNVLMISFSIITASVFIWQLVMNFNQIEYH